MTTIEDALDYGSPQTKMMISSLPAVAGDDMWVHSMQAVVFFMQEKPSESWWLAPTIEETTLTGNYYDFPQPPIDPTDEQIFEIVKQNVRELSKLPTSIALIELVDAACSEGPTIEEMIEDFLNLPASSERVQPHIALVHEKLKEPHLDEELDRVFRCYKDAIMRTKQLERYVQLSGVNITVVFSKENDRRQLFMAQYESKGEDRGSWILK